MKIVQAETIKQLARECGFELAGIARAEPISDDFARYEAWVNAGMAGKMSYLTDHRAHLRRDPRELLPAARSVVCVGKLYHQELVGDSAAATDGHASIARYAWTRDYHDVLREGLERLARRIAEEEPHEWRVCVDTAPLLERSYARQAGLGWIGRNQCLINEPLGSWFLLGELLTSLAIAPDAPPPDRCGTCARCIEACPTAAIIPSADSSEGRDGWVLDARRCIAYLNIELRGPIPEDLRPLMGSNVYGCDICQDVCPWNRRSPETTDAALRPAIDAAPALEPLAFLTEDEFRARYRHTPVIRPKYDGFLRNVAVAMGTSGEERFREPLQHLARSTSPLVAAHAQWALARLAESAAPAGTASREAASDKMEVEVSLDACIDASKS